MGWASGSSLFIAVWAAVRPFIDKVEHVRVCCDLMRSFEKRDCDTLMEAFSNSWPEVEVAYYTLHPECREDSHG